MYRHVSRTRIYTSVICETGHFWPFGSNSLITNQHCIELYLRQVSENQKKYFTTRHILLWGLYVLVNIILPLPHRQLTTKNAPTDIRKRSKFLYNRVHKHYAMYFLILMFFCIREKSFTNHIMRYYAVSLFKNKSLASFVCKLVTLVYIELPPFSTTVWKYL